MGGTEKRQTANILFVNKIVAALHEIQKLCKLTFTFDDLGINGKLSS